jgi:hypothetical protein
LRCSPAVGGLVGTRVQGTFFTGSIVQRPRTAPCHGADTSSNLVGAAMYSWDRGDGSRRECSVWTGSGRPERSRGSNPHPGAILTGALRSLPPSTPCVLSRRTSPPRSQRAFYSFYSLACAAILGTREAFPLCRRWLQWARVGARASRPEEPVVKQRATCARNAATAQAGYWRRVVMGTPPNLWAGLSSIGRAPPLLTAGV